MLGIFPVVQARLDSGLVSYKPSLYHVMYCLLYSVVSNELLGSYPEVLLDLEQF